MKEKPKRLEAAIRRRISRRAVGSSRVNNSDEEQRGFPSLTRLHLRRSCRSSKGSSDISHTDTTTRRRPALRVQQATSDERTLESRGQRTGAPAIFYPRSRENALSASEVSLSDGRLRGRQICRPKMYDTAVAKRRLPRPRRRRRGTVQRRRNTTRETYIRDRRRPETAIKSENYGNECELTCSTMLFFFTRHGRASSCVATPPRNPRGLACVWIRTSVSRRRTSRYPDATTSREIPTLYRRFSIVYDRHRRSPAT